MLVVDEGRRRHYGAFYGLDPVPEGAGLVLGNCQAESIRIVIDGVAGPTVRVPPVFEIEPDEIENLDRLLAQAAFIVLQPVRDDYRGMPLGSDQVRSRLNPDAQVALVPVVRYSGLHPAWMPMNVPGVDEDPPIVAYHDIRTLCRVAGLPVADRLAPEVVREIGAESVDEMRRRAEAAGAIPIADLFEDPDYDIARTPNHPGNPIFEGMGTRILDHLGAAGGPVDPGIPLLDAVDAPRDEWVIDAWGLSDAPRPTWRVGDREVEVETIAEAHTAWYQAHPEFVRGAMERLGPLVERWRAA